MEQPFDYRKFAVLYVDDEEKSLKYFSRAFGEHFEILTATNAHDGFRLLQEHAPRIGILISDQRMPGEKGIWLLEQSRKLYPGIIRILATAYAEMDTAIAAVNSGAIYKYVTKPWDPAQLEQTLKRSLEFFMVTRERDQLLREKMSVLHNRMIADRIVSLGLLAAGLSHHIRNSLVAVKTFLDLAPAKLADEKSSTATLRHPDFWRDYHQHALQQIEKINHLLKDLWAAAEPTAYQFPDTVQIRELIDASVAAQQAGFAGKQIEVRNEIPANLPELKVNRAKILRLFDLLFKDELASLPAGSRITLTARALNGATEHPAVEIQVSDNGPGLPLEALRIVFDPFVVRADNPMEYGIHLMACYFIAHHHGGRIDARNEDGGSSFTIRLPLDPATAAPSSDTTEFSQRTLSSDELWRTVNSH